MKSESNGKPNGFRQSVTAKLNEICIGASSSIGTLKSGLVNLGFVSNAWTTPDAPDVLDPSLVSRLCKSYGFKEEQVTRCWTFFKNESDTNGCIGIETVQVILTGLGEKLSEKECLEIINRLTGKTRTGTLDFEEFMTIFAFTPSNRQKVVNFQVDKVAMKVRKHMQHTALTNEERAEELGASCRAVKEYIRKELSEAGACLELPGVVLLFVAYVLAVCFHERYWILFAVDNAITFDITENANFAFSGNQPFENGRMGHKTIFDVNNVPDFWSWMSMGLVPLLWIEAWDLSEARANVVAMCTNASEALKSFGWSAKEAQRTGLPALFKDCPDGVSELPREYFGEQSEARYGMYLYYNRMVGGLRLRQEATEEIECPGDSELVSSIYGGPCFPDRYWTQLESYHGLGMNKDDIRRPGTEPTVLRTGWTQAEVRAKLRELEDAVWFSPATQKMEGTFITYNGHLNSLTVTYLNFFFTRAGHIMKQVEPVTIWLHPYGTGQGFCIALDVLWALLVLRILFIEILDMSRYICQLGVIRGMKGYAGIWNLVDWASCGTALVIMIMWLNQNLIVNSLATHLATGDQKVKGSWEDESKILKFFDEADDVVQHTLDLRRCMAFYPMVISGRFFKAFAAQPRLGLVVNTLAQAFTDIYHFGVVFLAVFMGYVVSGMLLFGEEIDEFSYFGRSMMSCWRLLLGDFDFQELEQVGRAWAACWFWSFTILVLQLMLNMLLAVIMDVYTLVKSNASNAETVFSQSVELWKRYRNVKAGREVSLEKILKVLDPTCLDEGDDDGNDEMYTPQALMKKVSGLQEEQATRIVVSALECDPDDHEDMSMSTAVNKISKMYHNQQECQHSLEQLVKLAETLVGKLKHLIPPEELNKTAPQQTAGCADSAAGNAGAAGSGQLPGIVAAVVERAVAARIAQPARALATSCDLMINQVDGIQKQMDGQLRAMQQRVDVLNKSVGQLTSPDGADALQRPDGNFRVN